MGKKLKKHLDDALFKTLLQNEVRRIFPKTKRFKLVSWGYKKAGILWKVMCKLDNDRTYVFFFNTGEVFHG